MAQSQLPLAGIRVVDMTTFVAAPGCSRVLAEWGADVIKVESLTGDAQRFFAKRFFIPVEGDENIVFDIGNANKRGISVNLKRGEGQAIMHRLLETADVLVTNYRTEALKKLGLSYEQLSPRYPRLIFGNISGFGDLGPDANRPGYDVSAFWARGGIMSQLGEPDAPPLAPWAGVGDQPTGVFLAGGIAAALFSRERTGKGEKVDVALFHSAIWTMALLIAPCNYRRNGFPKKSRKGPQNPVANVYRCKDGKWICIIFPEHEKHWGTFCKTIGREDLIGDKRYNTVQAAHENSVELIAIIDKQMAAKARDQWVKIWTEADLAFEVVQDFHEILDDRQAIANRFLEEVELPGGKKALIPTIPVRLSTSGRRPFKRGPKLGEHTAEVLSQLGFSKTEIDELRRNGIVKTE